jgi:hypothetical protein
VSEWIDREGTINSVQMTVDVGGRRGKRETGGQKETIHKQTKKKQY